MRLDHTKNGVKFDRLLTIGPAFLTRSGRRNRWFVVAVCACGGGRVVCVALDSLAAGTGSCGCRQREAAARLCRERADSLTGTYRHGGRNQRLYGVWRGMRSRCENPNATGYANYGGRGIVVCDEWHDFVCFRAWAEAADYVPGLEIDRINNDGNYEPDNCRWVTPKVNSRNTRTVRKVTAFGETKCISEWAEDPRAAVSHWGIRDRLSAGWAAEEAIALPRTDSRAPSTI